MKAVKSLSDQEKELTLFVTSSRIADHKSLAERMYRSGYNVTVEMNGKHQKNFTVHYIDMAGGITEWKVPYQQLDSKADSASTCCFGIANVIFQDWLEVFDILKQVNNVTPQNRG